MAKIDELIFGSASESLWGEVEQVLLAHYNNPDLEAARALYAAIMAHYLEGPSVWPMLVAPPGSMKAELLNALSDVPSIHLIDQISPQAFISGQIANGSTRSPSLLKRIGNSGILICADFSTVLAMKPEHRASIFADLRGIYDGQLRKEFGTVDDPLQHQWMGRLTFVAAVTPAVDRHHGFSSRLATDLSCPLAHAGGIEAALVAMNQDGKPAKAELNKVVRKLFCTARDSKPTIPKRRRKFNFTDLGQWCSSI